MRPVVPASITRCYDPSGCKYAPRCERTAPVPEGEIAVTALYHRIDDTCAAYMPFATDCEEEE